MHGLLAMGRSFLCMQPLALLRQSVPFQLGFGAHVERLDNPGVHGGNHIRSTIQIFLRDTSFPCVRKAPFNSRLTIADHGNSQSHKDFFALREIWHRMRITVKGAKVGSLTHRVLLTKAVAAQMPGLESLQGQG